MAKIRRFKLSWKPSASDQIVGYKLYWSKDDSINYDSNFIELGNVCEATIPDVIKYPPPQNVTLRLGISAVDIAGSESDIATLTDNYQVTVPKAPSDLSLKTLDDFAVIESNDEDLKDSESPPENDPQEKELEALAGMAERLKKSNQPEFRAKSFDDVEETEA
jgi:hypothetical protein